MTSCLLNGDLRGDYAVRRPKSERASAVAPTQAEAIERAREMNPGKGHLVKQTRQKHSPAGSRVTLN